MAFPKGGPQQGPKPSKGPNPNFHGDFGSFDKKADKKFGEGSKKDMKAHKAFQKAHGKKSMRGC